MNISEVKVKLQGSDILSIINEFIKIQGLTVKSVTIDNGIIIEGSFKKGIKIDFFIEIQLIKCIDNKITVKIIKAKIMHLGIFRILRSLILKILTKIFKEYGIENNKDKAIINVEMLLKDVPYVNLKVDEIYMKTSEIWIEASDINVSIAGSLIKKADVDEIKEVEEDDEINLEELESIKKVEDYYSKGRKILEDKLPEEVKGYKDYIFVLPDIVSLIVRLLKDKRVPLDTKIIMSAAIAYITLPTDAIPDNIPFIGSIDEIAVAFFALDKVVNDVPLSVIVENWEGENDLLIVLKNGFDYLIDYTGAKNIEKLLIIMKELSSL